MRRYQRLVIRYVSRYQSWIAMYNDIKRWSNMYRDTKSWPGCIAILSHSRCLTIPSHSSAIRITKQCIVTVLFYNYIKSLKSMYHDTKPCFVGTTIPRHDSLRLTVRSRDSLGACIKIQCFNRYNETKPWCNIYGVGQSHDLLGIKIQWHASGMYIRKLIHGSIGITNEICSCDYLPNTMLQLQTGTVVLKNGLINISSKRIFNVLKLFDSK